LYLAKEVGDKCRFKEVANRADRRCQTAVLEISFSGHFHRFNYFVREQVLNRLRQGDVG
jgi:hypothetical protein